MTVRLVVLSEVRADMPTPHLGHIYPRALLERELQRVSTERRVGELGPSDAVTLGNVTHLVSKAWVEASGEVAVEVEVLDTPRGSVLLWLATVRPITLRAILCGAGTVVNRVVQDDYRLGSINIDMVPDSRGQHQAT
jgi:hypothetical protein